MKVKYDKETDILYISLSAEPIVESDEDKPGVILDYSGSGSLVGIEILDASKKCPSQTPLRWNLPECRLNQYYSQIKRVSKIDNNYPTNPLDLAKILVQNRTRIPARKFRPACG